MWFHNLYSDNAWFSDDFVNNFSYFQYCSDICFWISVHDFVFIYLILHSQFFIITVFCFQLILELCFRNQFIFNMILYSNIFIMLNTIHFSCLTICIFVFSIFLIILIILFYFTFLIISDCFYFFYFQTFLQLWVHVAKIWCIIN